MALAAAPLAAGLLATLGSPAYAATDTIAPADITTAPSGPAFTNSSPSLSWAATTDAGGSGLKQYNVRRNGTYIASVTAPATSFTDGSLSDGTYTYYVRGEDNAGNKAVDYSPAYTVVLDTVAPAAPTGLAVSGTSDAALSWSASSDAASGIASYRVLRDGTAIATVSGTSYTDAAVPAGATPSYTVVAVDRAGNASAPSAPVTFGTSSSGNPLLSLLPNTTSGIHIASSIEMFGGARIPDLATAQRVAHAFDAIWVTPGQIGSFAPAMRQANPNLRIYLYQNGMFAQSGQGSFFPASWYLLGRSGNRIQSKGYGNYVMNPTVTTPFTTGGVTYDGWTDWVRKRCAQYLAQYAGTFDGCFIDMLGTAPLSAGYNKNNDVPIDPATGQPFTPAQWLTMTGRVGHAVETYTGTPVIGNGLASGRRFYSDPSSTLLQQITGGDAEVWLRTPGSPVTTYPTLTTWKQNVQMLIDAAASGNFANATVKCWSGGTAAQIAAWRKFALASYLIGNSGHDVFEFTSGQNVLPWNDLSPLYSLPIGTPTESYPTVDGYFRNGVYERHFSTGLVLVNPSSSTVTVPLGGSYTTPSGSVVSSVTLAANDAEILTD